MTLTWKRSGERSNRHNDSLPRGTEPIVDGVMVEDSVLIDFVQQRGFFRRHLRSVPRH